MGRGRWGNERVAGVGREGGNERIVRVGSGRGGNVRVVGVGGGGEEK